MQTKPYNQAQRLKACVFRLGRPAFAATFLALALLIGIRSESQAQSCPISTCTAPGTFGGFNVDATVRATSSFNDWFIADTNNTSANLGVIAFDASTQAFVTALNASGHNNISFVQRMSVPFGFPASPTIQLLDAVAGRDNHCAGGQLDSSMFTSGSDKNAANTKTWSFGISSMPQKNDIIDVGGHIRRVVNPTTGNPDLLGYAFGTTRNVNGDSHLDFEIFRTYPRIIGGQMVDGGQDSGHTASILPLSGPFTPANFQAGDLIVSIDYSNGGSNPCGTVYVWINPNNVDGTNTGNLLADYNASGQGKFEFTGVFYSGTDAAPFGYAQIRPRVTTTCTNGGIFTSITNLNTAVQGAPWGSLNAQNAAFQTNIQPLQLVEVFINFSEFGLDVAPILGPCVNIFGSLAVKSRSSTSFTSELKDFAGPYLFGAFSELNADAGHDKNLSCSYPTAVLNGSSSNSNATYAWYSIPSNTLIGTTPDITVSQPGCYYLVLNDPYLPTCSDTDTVCVTTDIDSIAPDITCPPTMNIKCNNLIPAGATTFNGFLAMGGTIIDLSGDISVSYVDFPTTVGSCGDTVFRTYTVTDTCLNSSTCTQLIVINDDIDPQITGPADLALGCNPTIPAGNPSDATATDNCGIPTVTVLPDVITGTCLKTLTRTFRATDGCGNTTDYVQTITYKSDTQAPVITATGSTANNGDIGCNPTSAQINAALGTATATDNCDNVTTSFTDGAVVNNGCNRTQTRSWTAVDQCGNTATTVTRTISWKEDLTAPVITATGSVANNSDLGCNPTPAQIDAALGSATASDNCDNVTPTVSTGAVVSNGCSRSQTRTWNAVDLCGNNATAVTRTITWKVDLTAPVITATGSVANNSDLGCNPTASQIDAALGTATATDNCDNVTPTVSTGAVVSNGCSRSQTRTWNVVDLCGNNATAVTRTITWKVDLTAPVITATGSVANNSDLGCNPTATQIDAALGTATATDNCDNVTPTVSTGAVVSNGCSRSQTRTWNAVDLCGNNATAVTRTITWKVDTIAPAITATGSVANNSDLGCNPTATQIDAALGTATATDNCDNVTPTVSTGAVVSNGCSRSQTRTWNVVDLCGNNATTVTRTITWKVDLTAPVITATGSVANNSDLGCNPTATQIDAALGTASATDNCDNVTPTVSTGAVVSNGCSRSQTRTWNAVDLCGNNATAVTRTITWKVDLTAPVITATGSVANNSDLGCNPTPAQIDAALGTATATDNCDNVTPTVSTGAVVSNGCSRSQTRTWNAVDLCGNNATAVTRTITWKVDTVAAVITATGTVPNNSDLGCNPTATQIDGALGTATATDGCGGTITPTPTTGSVVTNGCNRSQTRTWTAVDPCGNTSTTVSRTITWKVDLTAPVITATGSVANNSDLGCNPTATQIDAALGTATASDNCDNVTPTVSTGAVVSNGCSRSQTRTWNAVDLCGNNATAVTRTITWKVDLTAPVITATGSVANNSDLGCNPTATQIDAALGTATATDNCDNVTPTVSTGAVVSNGCSRSQTRTWNAVDLCGNNATAVTRTITWKVDLTAPVINATGSVANNSDLGCNPTATQIDAALGTATATDNCDNVTPTVSTGAVVSNGCSRSQTRTWNAVDLCGNNATAVTRTITWKVDLTAPVINATGSVANNSDLGCNPTAAQIDAALGTATATDNCDNVTPTVSTGAVVSNGCSRSQTRTWNAVDLCGNNATTVTRTITWTSDTQAPVVSCNVPGNSITVCEGSALNIPTPSATDNCSGSVPVTCTRSDGQAMTAPYPVGSTVTVACSATDGCNNTGTCSFTVRVVRNPSCTITAPASAPICGSSNNSLSASASNLDGTTTYSWSVTGTGWTINAPANGTSITYTAGSGTATFTLTVTNTVNGVACVSQCTLNVTCITPVSCTYTQGYYGNAGGNNCTGQNTTHLLNIVLSSPLVIGDPAKGRSLTLTQSDVGSGCIYQRLPGGGPSAVLGANATCSNMAGIQLKGNGTIRNVFLAQTITLGLNLRVPNSGLSSMRITGPYLVTLEASSGSCNTPNTGTGIPGTEIVRMIPPSVVAYLGTNNTVADLKALADTALSTVPAPAGMPSLSAIQSAVAAFNEAFDECRVLEGFYQSNPLDTVNSSTTTRNIDAASSAMVGVYPNPAQDIANIEFILNGYDSDVTLEIYDLNGTRIDVLFNARAEGDVPYRTVLDAGKLPAGVYMYRLTSAKGILTDRITIVK